MALLLSEPRFDISVPQPADDIEAAADELVDEFSLFDDWMDRYQYLIDLGRKMDAMPEDHRAEDLKLQGCQSQVWLCAVQDDGRLCFSAASDSAIVSGLIATLMRVYNGRRPDEILGKQPDFIKEIGLDEHLSPTRGNGLAAMLKRIYGMAEEAKAA
ncbi:MAG: SufE family protein [Magnetovibrionaceae bacterium]